MRDYVRRFLIAIIMAIFISLLFLGGKHPQATAINENNSGESRWIWPADGVISDTYGTRLGKHKGIDIAGKLGTPILAVENGVVEKSYFSDTYGNVVFIKHPSQFVTVYAHLNERSVSDGQTIRQGEMIGRMGQTGQATGIHLHFETHQLEWRYDKKYAIDPERLLGKAGIEESIQGGIAGIRDVLVASSHMHLQPGLGVSATSIDRQDEKYIVKPGDTLYTIALKENVTVAQIKQINDIRSDLIKPYQILTLR